MSTIFEHLKSTTDGAKIIAAWLGDGGNPVPRPQAEERAAICRTCEENQLGNWWTTGTSALAEGIRKGLQLAKDCNITVSEEWQLGTCSACFCNLPLKVHCPIEYIRQYMTEEKFVRFPRHCWIKQEIGTI